MGLKIDFAKGGVLVLDRIVQAYGFKTKLALADHLDIASSSLANRYKRDYFPSDIVVRCMAETGVTLEWLVTGEGPKFSKDELDILRIPRNKLAEGQLYEAGRLLLDKTAFLPCKPLPKDPVCILDDGISYIIEQATKESFDGDWLVEIEGKISIRTVTHIPVKRLKITGKGASIDCSIDEIKILGNVVLKIING